MDLENFLKFQSTAIFSHPKLTVKNYNFICIFKKDEIKTMFVEQENQTHKKNITNKQTKM